MTEPRIARLRAEMRRQGWDAFLVSSLPHVRYLTHFTGSNALCLVRARSVTLFTDTRYGRQCREETRGVQCRITTEPLIEAVGLFLQAGSAGSVGFEEQHISFHQYRALRRRTGAGPLVPTREVLERLCEVKDSGELSAIRRAVSISDRVFHEVLLRIVPGMTEFDLATEITWLHRKFGGEQDAFEPIVAAGQRGALPHARPTRNKLKTGDSVILDFGCTISGYHSDMTRTIAIGRISPELRRAYGAVHGAQDAALGQVRAGIRASLLDELARKELRKARLERRFVHSLGHGLGLQIHERPRISSKSSDVLVPGSVVTIEPGVYLPSLGGVRIEDDVLVTERGCEVLTRATRDLQIV